MNFSLEDIRASAVAALVERAGEFGLEAGRLQVSYVLNWGGFVNQSFHVSDGARRYHLKLASERELVDGLVQWRELHGLLEERYPAPHMAGWIDLPGTRHSGPLFEFVDGVMPVARSPALLANISPMLARLHQDGELAARVAAERQSMVCLESFLDTYLARFQGDVALITNAPPPFVDAAMVAWMQREIQQLEHTARAMEAFSEPVRSAIHGDLWLNNILVTDAGRYVVLDWDGLGLGDPAVDWAMFLGPTTQELRPLSMDDLPPEVPNDARFRERLAFYARASLFDWILDPLADWIDADAAPELVNEVRVEKERVHRGALASYRELYAPS
ncbi:MAG: phosphotransferase [Gemmatimonadota bacterium]|nr:phosphotransferase [Gemmatimonadota bacterium]